MATKTIIKTTNHNSEIVPDGEEHIAIGFINRGSFEMLNSCSIDYETLTPEERNKTDQFLDMIKTKMLACGDGTPDGGES